MFTKAAHTVQENYGLIVQAELKHEDPGYGLSLGPRCPRDASKKPGAQVHNYCRFMHRLPRNLATFMPNR